jgi:hypothetical protein
MENYGEDYRRFPVSCGPEVYRPTPLYRPKDFFAIQKREGR